MGDLVRVGILGATGYTGAELVRVIHGHPRLELGWLAARASVGCDLAEVVPSTAGIVGLGDSKIESFDPERASDLPERVDVVFTALPHGQSALAVGALVDAGLTVVDLSADFRLRDSEVYEKWYGDHPRKDLLDRAVYGLVELNRDALANAKLIAAPGCYPTSAILPLAPLLSGGLVQKHGLIVDAKSGVSGSGRTPTPATHLPEAAEGSRPYKIAGKHRHVPELEQELSRAAGESVSVVFTPQLVPMTRGISAVCYARPTAGTTAESCLAAARRAYDGTLVTVFDDDRIPDTLWVRGSARAHVAYAVDDHGSEAMVVAICAIDNLSRGAAAQAVQALNVSLGWPDATGLPEVGMFP